MTTETFSCPEGGKYNRGNDTHGVIQYTGDNFDAVKAFCGNTKVVEFGNTRLVVEGPRLNYDVNKGQIIVDEGRGDFSIWSVGNFLNVFKEHKS